MLRLLTFLCLAFWLVPLSGYGQLNESRKTVIVIDPGHGGTDSGAIGMNNYKEKDLVLRIAKEIVTLNESLFKNSYDIYLTRYEDSLISLGDRTRLARTLNADVFVSLHCNHSENENTQGLEVYVPSKGKFIRESILLASNLQNVMLQNIGYKSRGVKFGNFQVLRETIGYCPTVLVELGFLSNTDEAQHLTEEENVLAIALSILNGLLNKE